MCSNSPNNRVRHTFAVKLEIKKWERNTTFEVAVRDPQLVIPERVRASPFHVPSWSKKPHVGRQCGHTPPEWVLLVPSDTGSGCG